MNLNLEKLGARVPEVRIFRHLRIVSQLTTRQLAKLVGCNSSLITHYESGRNPIPKARKIKLCKVFGITLLQLDSYAKGLTPIPINYRDESVFLITKMDEANLKIVYGLLLNLTKQN